MANFDRSDLTLSLDALVRSIAVNKDSPHAFFLGAGASISSGVPSATTCIWQWKSTIFLTKNAGLHHQLSDISLPSIQQKIQQWLDSEGGYPPQQSPEEYGFYAETCYPIPQDRRQYFQHLAAQAQPYVGYKLLCLLAEADIVKSVWTTNFDGLFNRASSASRVTAVEVGLDTTDRVLRARRKGEVLCVALHGDYRYDALKNTPQELQTQDQTLRRALVHHLKDVSLVACGYSGRDQSIMDALIEAYGHSGSGRLYWCGFEDPEPSERVKELLLMARSHGRVAYYVQSFGFDDLAIRLSLNCLQNDLAEEARSLSTQALHMSGTQSPPFTVDAASTIGIVKSNAFPIECPADVLQFEADGFREEGAWRFLKEAIAETRVVAVLQSGKALAIGAVDEIRTAFEGKLTSDIERSPITEIELGRADSIIVSLLTQTLVRAIAASRDLFSDNSRMLWGRQPTQHVTLQDVSYRVYDAAVLFLRRYGGKQYVVIKPTIRGENLDGSSVPVAIEQELKRQLLTRQYNKEFNAALEQWRTVIFPNRGETFEWPPASESPFRFKVKSSPAFARVGSNRKGPSLALKPNFLPHLIFSGSQYAEPRLVFAAKQGDGFVTDSHPLRGIVNNQPYDYALTREGIGRESVRLGVVCPTQDGKRVSAYLHGLHQIKRPTSKDEYLLPYPGFAQAFALPLDIPQLPSIAWTTCPEPDQRLGTMQGAEELRRQITSSIRAVYAAAAPTVVLVYIPERWKKWEQYDADGEHFDLHDYVKAYCVKSGIATQFLREATLAKTHQCEVAWWLALSFYAKSMRTPWILEGFDAGTAFMGLGFSLDTRAQRGSHVILGCSHIYNAQGLGLRFKLSKVDNPIVRRGNPFMSFDDARRMGINVRQLFFESVFNLPKRVVIHKRTPFSQDERAGLLEGLAGIDVIDMLEINVDPALRYVASKVLPNGNFEGDGFPVRRGTCVVLDGKRALLWVHGTAESINPRKPNYYLGKSRIPAPLVITRHHGTSNLNQLATEILGLSKMNWNNFEMYTKLPATIESSNAIARIGALLDRFGPLSYDYRLFI